MPTQRLPKRFDPFHERLTVVSVEAAHRHALAQRLAHDLADGHPAVDLRPISILRYADVVAFAGCLEAERATERAAVREQAETRLQAALTASDLAVARRDELASRIAQIDEDATQCDGVAAHADQLYQLIADATAESDARHREVEAAQQRLNHVLEQRYAGRAAVEGAERQLATVSGAGLGELDLRRGLEALQHRDATERYAALVVEDAERTCEHAVEAQQLWEQIEAVRTALDEAEATARQGLDAAARAASVANEASDRNARLLRTAARRAHDLAAGLPSDLRPALGPRPLDGLSELADALRASVERQRQDLTTAAATVERAARDAELAATDLYTMRAQLDGAESSVEIADALDELVTSERGRRIILDGAFDGVDARARDAFLAAVLDVSAMQPTIVVTDDNDVVGWAIGLPAEVGLVTTSAALLAAAAVEAATEPESLTG